MLTFSDTGRFPLPVRVAPHPRATGACKAWNTLAGKQLFRLTTTSPQVTVTDEPADTASWVSLQPGYTQGPYTSAVVHLPDGIHDRWVRHEFGHVLGFADSVPATQLTQRNYTNPRVCDDPSHPLYLRYDGVMSYCGRQRLTAADLRLLRDAGYLTRPEWLRAYARLAGNWRRYRYA